MCRQSTHAQAHMLDRRTSQHEIYLGIEKQCYLIKLKWWLSFWERERTNHHMAAVAISHKCICTYFGNRCIWLEFTVNGIFSHHKLLRSCVCCTVFIEMLWFFHMGRVSVWLLYPKIETHRKNHDKCSIFALHFDWTDGVIRIDLIVRSFVYSIVSNSTGP